MPEIRVQGEARLNDGEKKVVKAGETEVLLIRLGETLIGVQAKCPHAGAPLEQGAICNGRLVCPWHMGTFALPSGNLLEPPALKGLRTYAVRVEGNDVLVSDEARGENAAVMAGAANSRTFLLVGAGAASTMAALTLRREGFAGRVLVIDPEPDEPLDRTQLSKQALAGKMPLDKTAIDVFSSLGVEKLTASVVELNADRREATLSTGAVVSFDAALIATGGTPKRLDLPGAELAFTLRHSGDVKQILERAGEGRHAVVLGTSFIGLEAASALTQKGVRVTVVGKEAALPFAKQFGDRVAKAMVALHKKNGVSFELDVEALGVTGQGIRLRQKQDERELAADLVLMGVGVSPKLTFKHDLPVAGADDGIRTDGTLRAAADVFVGGDIANVDGTRIEHWRVAEQHGMLAARNMLGFNQRYEGVPFFWTFHFGKRFSYLGHAATWDEIVYDGDVEALTFLAFFLKEGAVAAVLSCGRDQETAALAEPMRGGATLAELRTYL